MPDISAVPAITENRKRRPSGRKTGQRWRPSVGDGFVASTRTPPAAGTRKSGGSLVEKRMTPPAFQVPPPWTPIASQRVCGGPPATGTFFNFPPAKNAIQELSGDQKGFTAPSVPDSTRASR